MTAPQDRPPAEFALIQLLPNMLTITAICAGLTSIRAGFQGNYVFAVQLIMLACVLDGLDGRLARLLGSDSKMGAELDSLADFLNFGVATPLLVYCWGLQGLPNAIWIPVLVFSICCVVRLARFNVSAKSDEITVDPAYFTGVPAPAGALLVMLPMFVSFSVTDEPVWPGWLTGFYMILIGFLMISRIPTWSFKSTRISRKNVKYFLVGFTCVGAGLMTNPWTMLVIICLCYIGVVLWALIDKRTR